jgi:hypothetical protein
LGQPGFDTTAGSRALLFYHCHGWAGQTSFASFFHIQRLSLGGFLKIAILKVFDASPVINTSYAVIFQKRFEPAAGRYLSISVGRFSPRRAKNDPQKKKSTTLPKAKDATA